MDNLLTLDGLRYLLKLKEEGKELPKGYETLVQEYIRMKFASVERYERALQRVKWQLKEAISIASALGVKVRIMRDL